MFSMALARSVHNHAPDALAFVHQVEPLVDVRQWHGVSDHRVDLDLSLHVPVDDFRHVGAAARPSECRSLQTRPVTSWNGRVAISAPAGATPMMTDWPQPRWHASSAW